MYIPKESFDSKVLRWSGLMLAGFIATVFAVGLASSGPSLLISEHTLDSAICATKKC